MPPRSALVEHKLARSKAEKVLTKMPSGFVEKYKHDLLSHWTEVFKIHFVIDEAIELCGMGSDEHKEACAILKEHNTSASAIRLEVAEQVYKEEENKARGFPACIPFEDDKYKWDYDDQGLVCRFNKETEEWECMDYEDASDDEDEEDCCDELEYESEDEDEDEDPK